LRLTNTYQALVSTVAANACGMGTTTAVVAAKAAVATAKIRQPRLASRAQGTIGCLLCGWCSRTTVEWPGFFHHTALHGRLPAFRKFPERYLRNYRRISWQSMATMGCPGRFCPARRTKRFRDVSGHGIALLG